METNKTRTIIINSQNTNATLKTSSGVFDNEAQSIKVNIIGVENTEKKIQTRGLAGKNQYYAYFPKFYKKELINSFILMLTWTIASIVVIVAGSTLLTILINKGMSPWISLLLLAPVAVLFSLLFIYTFRFRSFYDEAKSINFKDQKTLSINVQKLYRRLKVGYINVNWMCGLAYVLSFLALCAVLIICAANNGGKVDSIFTPAMNDYFISFLWIALTFVVAVILHAGMIVFNFLRTSRIDNYYNSFIVLPEEIEMLKKKTNRRDLVIFCVTTAIVGLAVWVLYKIINKKKTTAIVVNK